MVNNSYGVLVKFLIVITAVIYAVLDPCCCSLDYIPPIGVHASDGYDSDDGNHIKEDSREFLINKRTPGDVLKKKKDALTKGISQEEFDWWTDSFIKPFNPETREERSAENVKETPSAWTASPRISEWKALSDEEKRGKRKVVSLSSKMPGPLSREQGCSDNFKYDGTRKLLPINLEKQRDQIPCVEENTEIWANIIYLDRDYSEESEPHIPIQQETTSSPTGSLSADLNLGRNSQPEGQNTTKISDPKKRRWFNLFPWWQKK
ncbi:hypothetical protein C5167_029844 [Papaver somniferum]|uniref:uncharacterized protein LOC113328574 n=1 Tax=Papaver somniferum TaxID=3469 RepID=UPI000E6F7A35|nr:uncharacterized protein LOC113328574 [Papaver somniferum]RZC87292.1 hypothetical protein C5167_029844 [Papaver somniferum]